MSVARRSFVACHSETVDARRAPERFCNKSFRSCGCPRVRLRALWRHRKPFGSPSFEGPYCRRLEAESCGMVVLGQLWRKTWRTDWFATCNDVYPIVVKFRAAFEMLLFSEKSVMDPLGVWTPVSWTSSLFYHDVYEMCIAIWIISSSRHCTCRPSLFRTGSLLCTCFDESQQGHELLLDQPSL